MARFAAAGRQRTLDEARGDRGADGDKDQAAEELTAAAGPGSDPGAEFQAGERQGDADGTDGGRSHGEVDG